jgi:hypothetical protein
MIGGVKSMAWIKNEILGLVVAGAAWMIMWVLDIGGNTIQIANSDVSVRLAVAVVIGIIAGFIISAAAKKKHKNNDSVHEKR